MNKSIKDLTGQKFGRLQVIEFSHLDKKQAFWKCICDCEKDKPIGERTIHIKKSKYLLAGQTNSCGCLKREQLAEIRKLPKKHSKKEEYTKPFYKELKNNWNTLINRCHNKNFYKYKDYGAKGIYVCDEWRNGFWNFYNWSIENGYQRGYTLDRLGNNYQPDSCEWVSKEVNCSWTKNNTKITIRNVTKTAAEWAKDPECEVRPSTILARYKEGLRGTKLIKKRIKLEDRVIEIDGQIKTFSEWAKHAGISLYAFITRWRRGNRGKDLIKPRKAPKVS